MGNVEVVRAAFLDRDGVINKVVMREDKPASPRTYSEFEIIAGVGAEIERLKSAGLLIIVVTNQPDIARGKMSAEELDLMSSAIRSRFSVDEICICPHDGKEGCACRKPKAGMLFAAALRHEIDLSDSFMIGDSWVDMAAARNAGCGGVLLDAPYNREVDCDFRAATLGQAVTRILEWMG